MKNDRKEEKVAVMDIGDIVKQYLEQNGFDGLVEQFGECGCEVSDLFPCGTPHESCRAAYKIPCPCPPGANSVAVKKIGI